MVNLHKHIQLLFHPRLLHDSVRLTHHAIFSILFPSPFPPIISPCLPPSFFPPPGSGTGQLPAMWSLPSVVGTFILQRTRRSCSTTRHPWWTVTRSSSAWRRPGASCPFLSSPSSTIFTGEHLTGGVVGRDNWITCKEITLIWLQQLK